MSGDKAAASTVEFRCDFSGDVVAINRREFLGGASIGALLTALPSEMLEAGDKFQILQAT